MQFGPSLPNSSLSFTSTFVFFEQHFEQLSLIHRAGKRQIGSWAVSFLVSTQLPTIGAGRRISDCHHRPDTGSKVTTKPLPPSLWTGAGVVTSGWAWYLSDVPSKASVPRRVNSGKLLAITWHYSLKGRISQRELCCSDLSELFQRTYIYTVSQKRRHSLHSCPYLC